MYFSTFIAEGVILLVVSQLGSSEESVSLGLGQTGTTLAQLGPSVRDCQLFLKDFCLVMIVLKGL